MTDKQLPAANEPRGFDTHVHGLASESAHEQGSGVSTRTSVLTCHRQSRPPAAAQTTTTVHAISATSQSTRARQASHKMLWMKRASASPSNRSS